MKANHSLHMINMVVCSFAKLFAFSVTSRIRLLNSLFFINEALFTIWGKGGFCTRVRREMNNGLRLCLIVHLLLDQEIEHLHAQPFSVCRTVLSSRSQKRIDIWSNKEGCLVLKSMLHLQMAIYRDWICLVQFSLSLSWQIKKLPLICDP